MTSTASASAAAPLPYQVLARAGEGPTSHYRIVSLVHLGDGHLLAAFDGRETGEDVPDPTGLHQRRSRDGGRSWESIEDIRPADHEQRVWSTDPSYLHDPATGTLFLFHTRAKDRGVWDAVVGTDDEDRRVLGSALGVSHDEGRSWEFRSLTEIAKPPPLRAAFATSGSGIRLTRGPHAGRLVQPYCGWFPATAAAAEEDTADREEVVRSYCLFSDDHGETWTTEVFADPGNNGQLARRFPDAPPSDPRSRELLFTNTAHPTERERGTLHRSRDDGATWQELDVFAPGPCEYSVVQALEDGAIGLLWEVGATEIRFARREADQLDADRSDG